MDLWFSLLLTAVISFCIIYMLRKIPPKRPPRIYSFPMSIDELKPIDLESPLTGYSDYGQRVLSLSDKHRLDPDYSDEQFHVDIYKLWNLPIHGLLYQKLNRTGATS